MKGVYDLESEDMKLTLDTACMGEPVEQSSISAEAQRKHLFSYQDTGPAPLLLWHPPWTMRARSRQLGVEQHALQNDILHAALSAWVLEPLSLQIKHCSGMIKREQGHDNDDVTM